MNVQFTQTTHMGMVWTEKVFDCVMGYLKRDLDPIAGGTGSCPTNRKPIALLGAGQGGGRARSCAYATSCTGKCPHRLGVYRFSIRHINKHHPFTQRNIHLAGVN
ncbi:MAG: hypothetical protein HC853_01520 [Anaerolineae bacterium]|nr:hypothetical protein [Anaerolineae bacterium]